MNETCDSCHARPDEPCEPSCECASCVSRGVVEVTLSWAAAVLSDMDASVLDLDTVLSHLNAILANATDAEVRTEIEYKRLRASFARDLPATRAQYESEASDEYAWYRRAKRNVNLCLEFIRTTKSRKDSRAKEL